MSVFAIHGLLQLLFLLLTIVEFYLLATHTMFGPIPMEINFQAMLTMFHIISVFACVL